MSIRSDHKALMFIGVVGVLGAGVRVVRAAGKESVPQVQPALEHQVEAADSAASVQRNPRGRGGGRGGRSGSGRGRGRGATTGSPGRTRLDTAGDSAIGAVPAINQAPRRPVGPLDRPGYIGGRLDLDVATAAQIDSLPGVTALMARRIASDRAKRGPFLNAAGLRRVSGVGQGFLRLIDTLVTFSGTFAVAAPNDTIIKPRRKPRR
jgi:hypothetical protein